MICTKCNKSGVELNEGFFKPVGRHPKLGIPMKDFICNECSRAIDVTSREPGEDDEPIPTEW